MFEHCGGRFTAQCDLSWVRWCTPVTSALGRPKQEECHEFQPSLGYRVLNSELLSQKKRKKVFVNKEACIIVQVLEMFPL